MSTEAPPACDHKNCGTYDTEGARYSKIDAKGAKHYWQVYLVHCSCCDKVISSYEVEV